MDQRCYNINNFFIIVRDPHSFLLVVFFSFFVCIHDMDALSANRRINEYNRV